MIHSSLRPIALALVGAVLLMLGATTGSAFAHEVQHAAHHTGEMHTTGLCAWMCATAGAITTAVCHVTAGTLHEETTLPLLSGLCLFESCSTLQSRAPPLAALYV